MSNFSRWQAGTAALLALGLTSGAVAPFVSPAPTLALFLPRSDRKPRVLVVPPVSPAPTLAQPVFSDVPDNHWAKGFVTELAKMGIVPGFPDGTFRPDLPVTRSQYALYVSHAFQPSARREAGTFVDVPRNHPFYTAIITACTGGFLWGYPDRTFKPENPMSREEVLVSLANALGLTSEENQDKILNFYTDKSNISNPSYPPVVAATVHGIVVNYPNVKTLNPKRNATRAEVAAIIYQALVKQGRTPAINSPYIVTPKPAAPSP